MFPLSRLLLVPILAFVCLNGLATLSASAQETAVPQLDLSEVNQASSETSSASSPESVENADDKPLMLNMDSQTFRYNEQTGTMIATGLVRIVIEEQNSELLADKVTYDPNTQVLIAEGNVRIIREGEITDGSYARISLDQESALINDTSTKINAMRVNAKQAYVDEQYVELEDGQLLINLAELGKMLGQQNQLDPDDPSNQLSGVKPKVALRTGFQPFTLNSKKVLDFAEGDQEVETPTINGITKAAPDDYIAFYKDQGLRVNQSLIEKDSFDLIGARASEIDVTQYPDGYQEIDLKWPKLTIKNKPILTYPSLDFGLSQSSGRFDYLGPEVGFNQDLGGFYAGPGWDFRLGKGVAKVSPLLSYGKGRDRDDGAFTESSSELGLGFSAAYTDDRTRLEYARVTQNNYGVFYGERRLFDGNTRLLFSGNRDVNGPLINGSERPAFSTQLTDRRQLYKNDSFRLNSYTSVGVFDDEFNPTNNNDFFVTAPQADPEFAGRALLELQVNNTEPVWTVGENLEFGWAGQLSAAGYSTGDHQLVLRGGPTANFTVGDRFLSQAFYSIGATSGQSPFVFDTYFLGKQALTLNNAIKVNRFLTVGARNDLSLLRDNAQDDLLVGNTVYVSLGPKDVKFNVGFDFIRQRSFFGINFYPGSGTGSVDFDRARIFQPVTN